MNRQSISTLGYHLSLIHFLLGGMRRQGGAVKKKIAGAEYEVSPAGVIQDIGIFEGCPEYTPYFWEVVLNGLSETMFYLDEANDFVQIEQDDADRFPALQEEVGNYAHLTQSESGFVYFCVCTPAQKDRFEAQCATTHRCESCGEVFVADDPSDCPNCSEEEHWEDSPGYDDGSVT